MNVAWVSGARGFMGRHLSRCLAQKGFQVAGLGHGAWLETYALEWGVTKWINGQVAESNFDHLAHATGLPEIIFHLAGGSSVGASLDTPKEDFRRSVESTVKLLNWVRAYAPQSRVVLSSSAAVYGSGHSKPIRETDSLSPVSPYGYHKRMSELLFECYSRNFGLRTSVVRLFSVYGSELRKQLLWDLCKRFQRKPERIILQGHGQETRDWIEVSDAVRYMKQSADLASSDCFFVNGGRGLQVSVSEVAEFVRDIWRLKTIIEFNGLVRSGDPGYLVANTERASSYGFQSRVAWKEGIKAYVEWFQEKEGSKET